MDGQNRSGFEEALDGVEQGLASAPGGGPYFMGAELSLAGPIVCSHDTPIRRSDLWRSSEVKYPYDKGFDTR